MGSWLYLDTARLGQMSPAAQRAQQDFARLAGEVAGAIQFEDFLRHGFEALDPAFRDQLLGLATWPGMAGFKQSLRQLAGFKDDLPLLLAARSAELMKLAAILLLRSCRNILVTDLGWPPYHQILRAECNRTRRLITTVMLADDVLRGRLSADGVVEQLHHAFIQHQCDGLFLTAVSSKGARLPIERITQMVSGKCRFVVVDGAQDFCHVGWAAAHECCDLYLAGCHKWLGGYHPLGVACYGRRRSRKMIKSVLDKALHTRQVDDTLLHFVEEIQQARHGKLRETINLSALFSSAGAVHDAKRDDDARQGLQVRLSNAECVAGVAATTHWSTCLPDPSLRSGILLLEGTTKRVRNSSAEVIRQQFQQQDVILTAYEGGVLRLSMPSAPLERPDLGVLSDALISIA